MLTTRSVGHLCHEGARGRGRRSTEVSDSSGAEFQGTEGASPEEEPQAASVCDEPAGEDGQTTDPSEERLVDTLPQTIFEVDAQGLISYVNPSGLEMFRFTHADFEAGVGALEIIDPSDHERVAGAIGKMMDGRSTGAIREYLARRKDGTTFPCVVYSTLVPDAEGNPAGIRGILTDISEQKAMEKALRDEKEFTETIINSLNDIFYVLSVAKGGQLIRWNKAFTRVSGYSDDELASMTVFDFFDASGQQAQEEFLAKLMTEGSASIEGNAIMKDGTTRPYQFSSTLVRDEIGNPLYVTGLGRDLSELIAAEKTLRESEERYRQIFEHATEGIFQSTMDGKLRNINPSFARMYGYDSPRQMLEEVTDIATQVYFDPSEREKVKEQLVREGSIVGMDMRYRKRDGSPLWVTVNAHLVRDNEGNIAYLEGTTTDISQRKAAEERLRLAQFEVDKTLDQVVRVNEEGRIAYANEAAATAYGRTGEEMLGLSIWDISLNYPEAEWADLFSVTREMQTLVIEISAVHADGHVFPLEANINHLLFEGSEHVVIFARDVSERRLAEQRQEKLNEELFAINKELDDFAYVVSHDLKAPLRGISSLATWLLQDYSDRLDESGQEQLYLMLDRTKRMERLIESVLQYSRVGRMTESKELVDLNQLAADAIDMVSYAEGVKVGVEGKLPVVVCERTRMGQVFANLIGNAVKYIGRPDGVVRIWSEDDGDFWRIAVADNGPGIDPRYHEQIFGLFQSLSPSEDINSTGVGLTLVKKIVELHGGSVWVDSTAGEGSTFYFTLPKASEGQLEGGLSPN